MVGQILAMAFVPLFLLGLVMSWQPLVYIGIALFSLSVLFSLITLPVEFDASRRAMAAIDSQIASAIDILIHLGKLRDGSRKVVSIMEVGSIENHKIVLRPIYEFEETGTDDDGRIRGRWRKHLAQLTDPHKLVLAGLSDPLRPV